MELIVVIMLAFAAGIGIQAWQISRRTGQTMMQVLRGHPGEERQQAQGGKALQQPDRGDPGEER